MTLTKDTSCLIALLAIAVIILVIVIRRRCSCCTSETTDPPAETTTAAPLYGRRRGRRFWERHRERRGRLLAPDDAPPNWIPPRNYKNHPHSQDMKNFFKFLDTNGDGYVSWADFRLLPSWWTRGNKGSYFFYQYGKESGGPKDIWELSRFLDRIHW